MERLRTIFLAIRDRRMFQTLVIYAGAAWVIVEITDFAVSNYDLSRKLLDLVVFLLVLGFPAAMVVAWFHGEKGPQRLQRSEAALLLTLGVIGGIGTYRISTAEEWDLPPAGETAINLGESSVAVIPFENRIREAESEWLGEGLADLLTTDLAQIETLRVVSGQRLFDLLRQEGYKDAREIPDRLATRITRRAGARYMVTGSILGTPDDYTVTANLVDLRSGEVAAAAKARGKDVFALVDRISAELSSQILGGRIAGSPLPVAQVTTGDLEAYRAYRQGREAQRRFHWAEARAHYQRSVELDATFALAHLRLALTEFTLGNIAPGLESMQRAHVNLGSASERDRLLVDGLMALYMYNDRETAESRLRELVAKYPDDKDGQVVLWRLVPADERRELMEETMRLDPFFAPAYNELAYFVARRGEFQRADSLIARYSELLPGEPNPLDSRGEIREMAGDLVDARRHYREALAARPDFLPALQHLVRSYLRAGEPAAARVELQPYLTSLSPEARVEAHLLLGDAYAREGKFDEALAGYRESAEAGAQSQRPDLRARGLVDVARLAAFIGDYDLAAETAGALHRIDPFNSVALLTALESLGAQGRFDELETVKSQILKQAAESSAVQELQISEGLEELIRGFEAYYRGDYVAALEDFSVARRGMNAPPGLYFMWEEVGAHLELEHGKEALALVESLERVTREQHRVIPIANMRALYGTGRARELLDEPVAAAEAYEALIELLGDAVGEVPVLRDALDRLAALRAAAAPQAAPVRQAAPVPGG